MKMSESELTARCMNVLFDQVGPVEAERFVYILNRDNFDYTEWQKGLFSNESMESLAAKVRAHAHASHASATYRTG